MSERAGFLTRIFNGTRNGDESVSDPVASPNPPPSLFGQFGERSETVGEQIFAFSKRMDDVFSLRDEFASVAKPMHDFIASHSAAQTRLAEVSALLTRERSETQGLRTELNDLRREALRKGNELLAATTQLQSLEEAHSVLGSELKSARIDGANLATRLDWTHRELTNQAEAASAKDAIHLGLSEDLAKQESMLADTTARLSALHDTNSERETEIKRILQLVTQLQGDLSIAKRRIGELEAEGHSASLALASLDFKVASEQEARRIAEGAHAEDKIKFENNISTLSNEHDSLKTKHAATTSLFEQSRAQIAEKTEKARLSQRAAKDATADKIVFERRFTAMQDEVRRLVERSEMSDRSLEEAKERVTMLTSAMAAKDRQIEQLQTKAAAANAQLDEATTRFEHDRELLEVDNRKLIEENQTEKAERALAQGALQISRSSREKLMSQVEELKRGRSIKAEIPASGPTHTERDQAPPSNVHKFPAAEVTEDSSNASTN